MSDSELPLVIEPETLAERVSEPNLIILDMQAREQYLAGHVSGAINANYADFVAAKPPAMGLLPDMDKLSAVLSKLGLRDDAAVAVYDNEGGGRASRVIWTLHALGHRKASLLNGGLGAWVGGGQSLQQEEITTQATRYNARLADPSVLATRDYILSRLGDSDMALLDTRSQGEFLGLDLRARRGGHIPGAVNRNWTDNIDRSRENRLLASDQARDALHALGVTEDKEVVAYCQTHHRSAHTYVLLKHLGFSKVRGYAGAWSEWGNDPNTPIET